MQDTGKHNEQENKEVKGQNGGDQNSKL